MIEFPEDEADRLEEVLRRERSNIKFDEYRYGKGPNIERVRRLRRRLAELERVIRGEDK